ncbi:hypothetical protein H0H92_005859 [Tricholoma furcatifolium]|nr:hypothetical protein H0H92_005859 [Tricholoma furcatifolium]
MGKRTEHLFKNIRVYWLAFIVYWGIVLFGYDTGIAGGVVSEPYFRSHFGLTDPKHINDVSSNVVSVLQAGAFFGALGSAPISAKIGRRPTLFAFTLVFAVGAILTTVASGSNGLALIYSGRVISGVGIGAISAVSPAFVSECAPKEVRGRITGCFQIMVALGVMISYFINYGVGIHITSGVNVWRIPFGFQLVPAGIMAFGLLTIKESPRWLSSVDRRQEAIKTLAYLRKEPVTSRSVVEEMVEIEAAIEEERETRKGLGMREAFFGKGNFIRFVIAFVIFLLQQWAGQNSVNYYAPQIFAAIGYTGQKNSLLASGIYGVVKVVATSLFIFFGVETLGRKLSLFISAMGMGTLFYIIGAILKTHPPPPVVAGQPAPNPPPASRAMAGLLYIYALFPGFTSQISSPRGLGTTVLLLQARRNGCGLNQPSNRYTPVDFVVSKVTPQMVANLGYKIFLMFATVNIGAMAVFSLLIPETKGRSLEEMDIIFGSISEDQRKADIEKQAKALEDSNEKRSEEEESVDRQA